MVPELTRRKALAAAGIAGATTGVMVEFDEYKTDSVEEVVLRVHELEVAE